MGLDVQLKNGLTLAFPTPVLRIRIPDAEKVNGPLEKAILDRAKREDGADGPNVGGWRSRDDLLQWSDGAEAIRSVKTAINQAIARLTQLSLGPEGRSAQGEISAKAWANVCGPGEGIKPHIHPLSTWSGAYFVAGQAAVEGKPDSGVLELVDPRSRVTTLTTPGHPFGNNMRVSPTPGLLVVHPSWLTHFVNPYQGKKKRISIGFSVFVKGVKTHAGEPPATGADETS